MQEPFEVKAFHLSHWQALTLPAPRPLRGIGCQRPKTSENEP